jgi:hypothetical protein
MRSLRLWLSFVAILCYLEKDCVLLDFLMPYSFCHLWFVANDLTRLLTLQIVENCIKNTRVAEYRVPSPESENSSPESDNPSPSLKTRVPSPKTRVS